MARCGSKNCHQKDMSSKEIELCAQNLLTILGSIAKIIGGGTYMTVNNLKNLFAIMNKIFI